MSQVVLEPARILTEFPIAYKYEFYYNVSDQTKDLLCAAFSQLLVSRTATTSGTTTVIFHWQLSDMTRLSIKLSVQI